MSDISTTGKMLPEYNTGLATAKTLMQQTGMLNNISGHNGVEVVIDWNRAIRISLEDYFPESMWAFGVDMVNDTQIKIYEGDIILNGQNSMTAPEATLTMSGATEYVYVEAERDGSSGTITHSTSVPESTAKLLKLKICKLEADDGVWSITKRYHRGDFNFDTPMVG